TDFGTAKQGSNPPDRTFTVTNTGNGTLTLTTPDLPSGYTIIEPLSTSIPVGGSDSFTIRLSTSNPGLYGGEVFLHSNAGQNSTYSFAINGTVNEPGVVKINFQPA